jgi:predicted DNA-binding transcriptional regulator AlpA
MPLQLPTPDHFITRQELARRLSLTLKTLDRMRKDGRLPVGTKLGRMVRFFWPSILKTLL